MGSKKSYFPIGKRTLTLAVQGSGLTRLFPDSQVLLNKNVSLTWIGQLHPTPLSDTYTVKIKYSLRKRPAVTVVSPELSQRVDCRIPHVFPGNELCLFRYEYFEWDSSQSIAETIVPWTSLWLLHYEIWLATGTWCGSKQEHPPSGISKKPETSSNAV